MIDIIDSLEHYRYSILQAKVRGDVYLSMFGPDSGLVRKNLEDIYKLQRLVNILEIRLNRYVSQEKEY